MKSLVERAVIVSAALLFVVGLIYGPGLFLPGSGAAGASGAYSGSDCRAARAWIAGAGEITSAASTTGKIALDANNAAGSVIAAVEARHDIAALSAPSLVAQLRADTLAALDELAYQSALAVTAPYSVDSSAALFAIAAMKDDETAIESACSSSGSV